MAVKQTRPGGTGRAATTTNATRPAYCPCGCLTKLPYLDDPGCIRHLPLPRQLEDADYYDVTDLGLVPHDRGRCPSCLAVGA